MKIRNLMTMGLLVAGCAAMAQAQNYGYSVPAHRYAETRFDERRDIGRDLRVRENLLRRIEADRRAVEHERRELRYASWYNAGHESRELRAAQERLDCDYRELNAIDHDVNRDVRHYNRY